MSTYPSNSFVPPTISADDFRALQLENAKMERKIESLKRKNAVLSKKNKRNYLRIRLIRQYLRTLPLHLHDWSDEVDYGTVASNVKTNNAINSILSNVPAPKKWKNS